MAGRLGLSGGIASLESNEAQNADELLAMADKALYAAKDLGKGQIVLYSAIPDESEAPMQ